MRVNSNDIQIFPISTRDAKARVFSEENLVKFITSTVDNKSFVIGVDNDKKFLEFVIGGYYFKLSLTTTPTSTITEDTVTTTVNLLSSGNPIYAHIWLREYPYKENNKDYKFYILDGYDDENNLYTGFELTTSPDYDINTNPDKKDLQHLCLQLCDAEGSLLNTIKYNSYSIDCIDGGTC